LINFNINNTVFNIQLIPIYGFCAGILYYNPNLEPDLEPVDEDEYYEQLSIMILFFGFNITWFKT